MNLYLMMFLCGFAGSLAVEIITLYQIYQSTDISNARTKVLPARYRRLGFWIVRLLVAIIAGGLAIAYEINKPILAVNIGAATPLIIQALAQGIKSSNP